MPNKINPQQWTSEVWKTAFDAVEDLISVQDSDFNILTVNKAFAAAFGKKPEELIGRKCYSLIHGTEHPPGNCPGKTTLGCGKCSTENVTGELLGKDLQVMTSPITDDSGKVTAFVHICHDITDLNRARAGLEQSQKRYKAIVDNIQGGVIIRDKNGDVFINNKATELLGFSVQEMSDFRQLDFVAPEEKPRVGQMMAEWRTGSAPFMETECWVIRKDRKRMYLHIRASRIEPEGITLLVINDLTAVKDSQTKIETLYAEEKSLRDELQQEIARRTQYAHTLVHEIKTPLTPVLASSELLAERLTEEPWSSLAKNIFRGATILDRRIEELLDLANIEVGNMKLLPKTLDLSKTVTGVVAMVKSRLDANKQAVSLRLPKLPVLVTADDDRLYQVLLNLVNNAAKYSDGGTEITIVVSAGEKEASVLVSDHGRGMSEETMKHAFEPYFREDHAHQDGLGLGLPLANHLVQLQGGRMWIESEKGKGSTIGFSLPLAK